jgi:hypothetical protein
MDEMDGIRRDEYSYKTPERTYKVEKFRLMASFNCVNLLGKEARPGKPTHGRLEWVCGPAI